MTSENFEILKILIQTIGETKMKMKRYAQLSLVPVLLSSLPLLAGSVGWVGVKRYHFSINYDCYVPKNLRGFENLGGFARTIFLNVSRLKSFPTEPRRILNRH